MLIKPIYESVPYFYIIFGTFCVVLSSAITPTVIGVILFFYGANIWRIRSSARRIDHRVNRIRENKNLHYYEFKPFILLISGMLLHSGETNEVISLAGIMICFIGVWILFLRILNRRSRSLI